MKIIENQSFDWVRALYGCRDILAGNCSFDGPADGESAEIRRGSSNHYKGRQHQKSFVRADSGAGSRGSDYR